MNEQNGFFGSIFDSPEDDPLMHSDADASSDTRTSETSPSERAPDRPSSRAASSSGSGDEDDWMDQWLDEASSEETDYGEDQSFYDSLYGDGATGGDPSYADDSAKEMREVSVRGSDDARALHTVNAAIQEGWHLTHIDLDGEPDDGFGPASNDASHAPVPLFVITLERDEPRSLFDFGPNR